MNRNASASNNKKHDFKAAKKTAKRADKARLAAARAAAREDKHLRKHGPRAKTNFKRHVLPALVGLTVMLLVISGMNFQWIYAQYKYRTATPVVQATTVSQAPVTPQADPSAAVKDPNPEKGNRIEIPAISVSAPVQLNQGTAEWQIQMGLRKGVVHFDGSVLPGQTGNVVIFGHSSGALWAPGDYKFVFTMLDKLKTGDQILVYQDGYRYIYTMTRSQVVIPTDVGVLTSGSDHELTLITCTPVGTSTNRLVIHAKQTSPVPTAGGTASDPAPAGLRALPGSAH